MPMGQARLHIVLLAPSPRRTTVGPPWATSSSGLWAAMAGPQSVPAKRPLMRPAA